MRRPWVSAFRSDFNFDFGVSYTEDRLTEDELAHGVEHSFRRMPIDPQYLPNESPGMSAFILEARRGFARSVERRETRRSR